MSSIGGCQQQSHSSCRRHGVVTRRRPGRRHSPKTAKQNPLPQPTAPGSSLGLAQFRPSSHLAFQARFFTYGSHPGCAAVVLGGGARACVYGVPLRPWQFSFVTPNIKRSLSPFTHKARCATQQHTGVTHTNIRWCVAKESTVEPGARHLQTVQAGPSGPKPHHDGDDAALLVQRGLPITEVSESR